MQLRPYQQEAKQKVNNSFIDGVNKQVIVLATGTGKTIIFSNIINDRHNLSKKKALVLAHREELLTQAKDKIKEINPFLRVVIEQGENHAAEDDADVIIASVPTLGRSNSERIQKFNPLNFDTIIVDEAHHSSSDSYKNILSHFGVLRSSEEAQDDWNSGCLLLGVTATPSRNDNKGLDTIYDKVTFNYGIIQAIKEGYLAPIRAFRINTTTDLTQVHKTAGDFNLGELGERVNNDERNKLIIKSYLERVPGKQAICFAVDVAHTKELAEEFTRHGVSATYVVGELDRETRKQRLEDFANKKYQVMVNAMVLTEGYDNPSVEAVLMARPTQSGILFQQMIGRGTRLYPGKQCLTILDFVDNTHKQNLQTTASLIGLNQAVDFKGHDIVNVKAKIEELQELAPNVDLEKLDIDRIEYAIEEVDLLAGLKVPDEIAEDTRYDWHRFGEEEYRVGLGNAAYVSVSRTITGQYDVVRHTYDKETRKTLSYEVGTYPDIKNALFQADKFITREHSDSLTLINTQSTWRADKPSPAQLRLLKNKFKVNQMVIDQLTKGQASRLITKLIDHSNNSKTLV
jgi:superfamily II DNA or RNA helicase